MVKAKNVKAPEGFFGAHFSIEEIKSRLGVSKLDVIRNPKTDRLFVSANGKTVGAVGKSWEADEPSEFVELNITDAEGSPAVLLCLCNSTSENLVATL